VSEASVLARVLNSGELKDPEAIGEAGDGRELAGFDDVWEWSEL